MKGAQACVLACKHSVIPSVTLGYSVFHRIRVFSYVQDKQRTDGIIITRS